MLVISANLTVNFDNVLFMETKDDELVFFGGEWKIFMPFESPEEANKARRIVESAYAHRERICKFRERD